MSSQNLALAEARRLFRYDPHAGILYRRHGTREKVGKAKSNGYLVVGVGGIQYSVHRLAWFLMTGSWPTGSVDHINGVKTDNRWANLRDVTQRVNSRNVTAKGHAMLGPVPRGNEWFVRLPLFDEVRELGPFATHAEAHRVFCEEQEFAFWTEGKRRPRLLGL